MRSKRQTTGRRVRDKAIEPEVRGRKSDDTKPHGYQLSGQTRKGWLIQLRATLVPSVKSLNAWRKCKRLRPAEPKFHHNVYVVLLSKAALKDRSILQRNPERDSSKPAVYVGLTGLPVDHRFENHKNGYESARLVRKYGVRLLPETYEYLNPMPYEHAVQMERDLADDLRRKVMPSWAALDRD